MLKFSGMAIYGMDTLAILPGARAASRSYHQQQDVFLFHFNQTRQGKFFYA